MPGEKICYDLAFIYARAEEGGAEESIKSLKIKTRNLRTAYYNHLNNWDANMCNTENSSITNIKKLTPANTISVYPNPSNSYYFITNYSSNQYLRITNFLGTTVKTLSPGTTKFDLKNVEAGLYYLHTLEGTLSLIKL